MVRTNGAYETVNGLKMYYETHGRGEPLLLLHGAFMMVEDWGALLATLAETRQVIAVEQQAHGRTEDIDRPLTFEQMADDTAVLLEQVGIASADVFGYSDGGNVGLALAMRHPGLVRRLAVAGTNYTNEGLEPEVLSFLMGPPPDPAEDWVAEMRHAYEQVAPDPGAFGSLLAKVSAQAQGFQGWTEEEVRSIAAPVMVMIADADIVRTAHALEMSRLHRQSRLAILPGTDHTTLLGRHAWLAPMLLDFFEAELGAVEERD